jgi:polyhydroxyalkanoate synthase
MTVHAIPNRTIGVTRVETAPPQADEFAVVPHLPEALTISDQIDRLMHAAFARWTGGLSPAGLALAFADWQLHLATSPGKQMELALKAFGEGSRLLRMMATPHSAWQPWFMIAPRADDRRFSDPDWTLPTFNVVAQAFLLTERWWHEVTTGLHGVSKDHAAIADFVVRQCLDTVAPSNFAPSNPEVLRRTMESGGGNFVHGWHHWLADCFQMLGSPTADKQQVVVGKDIAVSEGKVVFRNELIELIQYAPTTATVRPEPILVVPAWIMKYYVLDLSPHNSMVRYLVENGFTVFMISWRNPGAAERDLDLEDYRKLGVGAAIDAVNQLMPGRAIHAAGYCLGGTLLAIAAAQLHKERPDCLRTVTLLAAQVDFTEAGELKLFINESQVALLEDVMWQRGVLEAAQMAGAFRLLRSNDLIWSRLVHDYLMGDRSPPSDLMTWNADATRMPYRMHSQYLRKLFLENDLAEGRYLVDGEAVALSDLRAPMFVVGTERDHVAPWRSTHKIHLLAEADVTFVLASGGHNTGIVAPPSEEGHSYRVLEKAREASYVGPDEWFREAPRRDGSWWPEWGRFLAGHSGEPISARGPDRPAQDGLVLENAPGRYVMEH